MWLQFDRTFCPTLSVKKISETVCNTALQVTQSTQNPHKKPENGFIYMTLLENKMYSTGNADFLQTFVNTTSVLR